MQISSEVKMLLVLITVISLGSNFKGKSAKFDWCIFSLLEIRNPSAICSFKVADLKDWF